MRLFQKLKPFCNYRNAVILLLGSLLLGGAIFLFFQQANTAEVGLLQRRRSPTSASMAQSALTGSPCKNATSRPYAVMLAEDKAARPLSGIAQADIVLEMPVITGSITRMMALFQCERPAEIGSVRSARHDFIPLAAGFDAIYAHWGGSRYALDQLKQGAIDNIDALTNPFSAFYRKAGIPPPHNGFSSWKRLDKAAEMWGYRQEHEFEGYPRTSPPNPPLLTKERGTKGGEVFVNYAWPFTVEWRYNKEDGKYYRWRGGSPEIDAANNEQAAASVVVIMRTNMRQLTPEYNDVDVAGSGEAFIYQEGRKIQGIWSKQEEPISSNLYFYDKNGVEIQFVQGKIWIEIVQI